MTDAEFREVFHRHKSVLHRFVFRMTGSGTVADDIVQDCFLAFWRKPEAYDPSRGAQRAYLLGIARKLVLKRWRRERPQEPLDDVQFVQPPLDLAEIGRAQAVERAILALPALQRETVVMAEYEEMSLEEIALATQSELAAVKSRLHRARQNLRRMLAPLLESKGVCNGTK